MNGVITNVIDVGFESFNDAVEAMMDKWDHLDAQERVEIAKRGYCNEIGEDYMIAVGSYDEETGEDWESMTLAEAIEEREEEDTECI